MYRFSTQVRVRYAETDKMGFVYYGNYATYYEVARVEALRALGIRYLDMEDAGVLMPVLENYSRFMRPARYDDLLTIYLELADLPTETIRFSYEIKNESGKLLHQGYTLLAFVSVATGRKTPCPENILVALSPYFPGE